MSGGRRLRKVLLGKAGPGPALILAGVTLIITFIVVAGPRALSAAGDRAVQQAATHAPTIDVGTLITADQQVSLPGPGRPAGLSAAAIAALSQSFGRALAAAGVPPAARWGGLSVPSRGIIRPARRRWADRRRLRSVTGPGWPRTPPSSPGGCHRGLRQSCAARAAACAWSRSAWL